MNLLQSTAPSIVKILKYSETWIYDRLYEIILQNIIRHQIYKKKGNNILCFQLWEAIFVNWKYSKLRWYRHCLVGKAPQSKCLHIPSHVTTCIPNCVLLNFPNIISIPIWNFQEFINYFWNILVLVYDLFFMFFFFWLQLFFMF